MTAVARWDPGELRDWKGRWAKSGSSEVAGADKYIASMTGKVHPRELDHYDVGQYKRERMDPAFRYTPEQEKAINAYTEHSFELNSDARGIPVKTRMFQADKLAAEADVISAAMKPLPDDLIVLRQLSGMNALEGVKPGDVIADDGFSSTALVPGRYAAGMSDTTVMHILTPAGTPVVWPGQFAAFPESEVLLDRGQPMVVMKMQQRTGRSNVTDVYLLAVPKGAVA